LSVFALAWVAQFLLFLSDWVDMVSQWLGSSTYNHIVLVPVILVWLVAQRATDVLRLSPRSWRYGLVLFGGAAVLWVLGSAAGLAIVRQAGVVAMLAATVPTLLGPRVSAALAFPLAYMVFLVPFGDELVIPLQLITAKLTIALVHLAGIPAHIDGVFIDTPAGLFEVAEACSGVKFLIAMLAFGVLTAHLCFRSWMRRAVFLAFSLIVPILANGVRAWGTVFAAQFVGAERATGMDHLIYGWVFFALVVAAVLGTAWRFFDRSTDSPPVDIAWIEKSKLIERLDRGAMALAPAFALIAALTLSAKAWALAGDRISAPLPNQVFLPEVSGWHRVDYAPVAWWEPRAGGAQHRLLGRYADSAGNQVDVFYALYARQGPGAKAAGAGEGAVPPESSWSWQAIGPDAADARSDRLLGGGRTERLAETRYRTGDLITGSAARLSLSTLRDRLLLSPRPTALLILSAEERPSHPAAESIAAFRHSTGPVGPWMDRIAGLR